MPPEDIIEAITLRHSTPDPSTGPTLALLQAGREADRRAPRPTEWEVCDGRLRARWLGPNACHCTVRILKVDGRWVAMSTARLDQFTFILTTHAATWASVVLDLLAAHEERASGPLDDNDAREAAEAVFPAFYEESHNVPPV